MKKFIALLLLCVACGAQAATPTTDTPLSVTLLPNSQYQVTATVSTNDVASLLALLAGGESPLQILDSNGNVLGAVPAQTLIDDLAGLVGAATKQVGVTLNTGAAPVTGLISRVLDSPPVIQVGAVSVNAVSSSNDRAPTVKVTHRQKSGMNYRIRGLATDDSIVKRVDVSTNGQQKKAAGTNRWHVTIKLHPGRNNIVIRAFDDTQHVSAPKRLHVFAGE